VPVLVVDEGMEKPVIAVAAVELRAGIARAARMAVELLGKSGTLYLVYAEEPIDLIPARRSLRLSSTIPGELVVLFRRLIEDLKPPAGVIVETVILNGAPVSGNRGIPASASAPTLLVTGTHGLSRAAMLLPRQRVDGTRSTVADTVSHRSGAKVKIRIPGDTA
jgi:hypothetical protein